MCVVGVYVCVRMCVCVRARARACVRARVLCVYMCVCKLDFSNRQVQCVMNHTSQWTALAQQGGSTSHLLAAAKEQVERVV